VWLSASAELQPWDDGKKWISGFADVATEFRLWLGIGLRLRLGLGLGDV